VGTEEAAHDLSLLKEETQAAYRCHAEGGLFLSEIIAVGLYHS
jgi:hypothetical protein